MSLHDDKETVYSPDDAWQFACEWYKEGEVFRSIQASKSLAADWTAPRVPEDVRSLEFAKWLTNEYRLAMAKGIQIGRLL